YDNSFKRSLASKSTFFVGRQENHSYPVLSRCRKREIDSAALSAEKLVRYLKKNSGAVAGVFLGAGSSTVLQTQKNRDCLFDNAMRFVPFYVSNKADTTSIALVARIVKTLFLRCFYRFSPHSRCSKSNCVVHEQRIVLSSLVTNAIAGIQQARL